MLRIIPATSLLLLSITLSSPAAEPEWKVGIAEVKITPERPVQAV